MAARLFALIIGIDRYRSGGIWNLHACVDDAKRIKHYLSDELHVPRDQIRLLLDRQATKQAIEDAFMEHLTNNTAIDRGDAMVIYFAGHGSHIPAPSGWFQGSRSGSNDVQVLCPYDHDTKQRGGRISGISDRSIHALIRELSQAKGDNITFIADCCFSPSNTPSDGRSRSHVRWTPTTKTKPDDLYSGLWPGARGRPHVEGLGFYDSNPSTHLFLSACGPGGGAVEGKDGGRFTSKLLQATMELALHRTSYEVLADHLNQKMIIDGQEPVCMGQHKGRIVFDAVPFVVDARYIPASQDNHTRLRIEAGIIQGIAEGTELSLHLHNNRGSKNPQIAIFSISEVHPTWSLGCLQAPSTAVPQIAWARVSKWNNRRPFRVHLKATALSLYQRWKVRRQISDKCGGSASKSGLNIVRVPNAAQADVSLTFGFHSNTVELHNVPSATNHHRAVTIDRRDVLDVIDDAARFYMHFHRRNPEYPLRDLITMELFRLDPLSWIKVGKNLLENGKANISYEKGAIFTIVINNESDMDLWPYLFYMDPSCFGITMLYHPEQPFQAPLPKRAHLQIGSGRPGSEALSFALPDHDSLDSGFLKLFLTPKPVSVGMIEQGPAQSSLSVSGRDVYLAPAGNAADRIWDTISACIQLLRSQ
jgi:hypothetical protein